MKGDVTPGATATSGGDRKDLPPPAGGVQCPRCDSANTKFCYYNNYSLAQPRHFCKTCRRYWTKGGALRNVPIGGGCRKSKKLMPSADVISSRFFPAGLSPAMDFQLSPAPPFPRLNHQFSPEGPSWLGGPDLGGAIQEMMSNINNNSNISIASSIESLSCMNQDLHWKLQQQRLSLLFGNGGGGSDKDHDNLNIVEDSSIVVPLDLHRQQKLQEPSSADVAATGWFFGNSLANHVSTTAGNDVGMTSATVSNWNNGFEAWSDHNHQFSTTLN